MSVRRYTAEGARLAAGFTALPNLVLRDTTLSATARFLYAIMLDLAWQSAEPEQEEFCRLVGLTDKPIRNAIRELTTAGLLTTKRRGQGNPNEYIIHEPQNRSSAGSRTGAAPDPLQDEDQLQDREPEAKASDSRRGTTGRPANIVFDALVAATAANPADGGMIGKAAKAIRAAETDRIRDLSERFLAENPSYDAVPPERIDKWLAAQIAHRATEYARLRPDWELTPTALAKHWNRITTWKPKGGSGRLMGAAEIAQLEDER